MGRSRNQERAATVRAARSLRAPLLTVAILALPVLSGLAVLAGCGLEPSSSSRAPVGLVGSDASPSFRPFVHDCARDFQKVATTVAERRGDIYGGALVTGNPFGQRLVIEKHFGASPPPSIQG